MDAKTYNLLKKVFPLAFKFNKGVKGGLLGLAIHLFGVPLAACLVGVITAFTVIIPVVVGVVAGAYGFVSSVLVVLLFLGLINEPEAVEEKAEENSDVE